MSDASPKRWLAIGAAALVVTGAIAVANQRADEQAAEGLRAYRGEQWDVARHCLVGTPIGRRDPVEHIAAQIESLTYDALAHLEGGAGRDSLWPLRCSGRLASLRGGGDDPGEHASELAALDLAMARMLDGPIETRAVPERARELAERVTRLDALMPPGAEYDPARYPARDPGAGRVAIARSAGCPATGRLRRPFLRAEVGGEALHDERRSGDVHERLVGAPDALRLETVDADGTHARPLDADGLRLPRFYAEALAWLTQDPPSVVLQIGEVRSDPVPLGLETVQRWALIDGIVIAKNERTWLVRTEAGDAPVAVAPEPPERGVVGASSPELTVLLWFAEGRWRGVRCAEACAEVPSLGAAGNLQVAVRGTDALVIARGVQSDMWFARRLEADGWSPPAPVSRGLLDATDEGFAIEDCEGAVSTSDGETWTDAP